MDRQILRNIERAQQTAVAIEHRPVRLAFFEVIIVPDANWTAGAGRRIVERVRERMGDIGVEVRLVTSIPRGPNGKFRAVMCQVPREELDRIAGSIATGATS